MLYTVKVCTGGFMVILLSSRNSKCEKEIVEILKNNGANHISDRNIDTNHGNLTAISIYKKTDLNLKNAVAIFVEKSQRFTLQKFPIGIIGIAEDNNKAALSNFKKSGNAVITCGINNKNTITISSLNHENALVTLQRSIIDLNGNIVDPAEYKITLSKQYTPFSIMACAITLILKGIEPTLF